MRSTWLLLSSCCRIVAGAAFAVSAAGCSPWRDGNPCESSEEYQAAQVSAPVSVPAGLDAPDQASHLNIPEGPTAAEPLSRNAACLQRPPDYFDKPVKGAGN
jgi:uncharacterized lipoprotein